MKILISGVGVAGPALSYWLLTKGKGEHEIVMVEKSPKLRTGGYLVDFWGVGYRVASLMGLEKRVKEEGYKASDIVFVNEDGVQEGGFKMELLDDLLGGEISTLRRSDLAKLIYDKLPLDETKEYAGFTYEDKSKIEVRFGTSVTNLVTGTSDSEQVPKTTVTFSDGTSEVFDLVVGADGLHSTVRALAFKDEIPAEGALKDLGMTVAAVELSGSDLPPKSYEVHSIPGRTVIIYEMGDDKYMAMFIAAEPADLSKLATPELRKDWVLEKFKDVKFRSPKLLEAVKQEKDLYVDTVSQARLGTWAKPGVVLVGDAAGAPSLLAGEGTGLGITGAYCLAHALNTTSNLESALKKYESTVKPYVTEKQDNALGFLFVFGPKSWLDIWVRNTISKLFMFKPVARWVLGSSLVDNFELPEY